MKILKTGMGSDPKILHRLSMSKFVKNKRMNFSPISLVSFIMAFRVVILDKQIDLCK